MTSSDEVDVSVPRVGRSLARLADKRLAPPVKEFAEHLRDLRQRTGLTSQRLEKELGMAPASLSRYLSGERLPHLAWLRQFQDWLAENAEAGLTAEERTAGRNLLYAAALEKNVVIARELELDHLDGLWAARITKVEQEIGTVQDQLASLRTDQATDHAAIADLEAELAQLQDLVALLQNDRHQFADLASQTTLAEHEPEAATETQPADHPRAWGSVPLRNPDFVGREDLLEQLQTSLVEPVVLHGMAGVGKTQIVAEHLHRHASKYDLVWWVGAAGDLVDLANRMGLKSNPPEAAIAAVLDALRTGEPYRSWILVFDHFPRPETVRWLMPAGPGQVVITAVP